MSDETLSSPPPSLPMPIDDQALAASRRLVAAAARRAPRPARSRARASRRAARASASVVIVAAHFRRARARPVRSRSIVCRNTRCRSRRSARGERAGSSRRAPGCGPRGRAQSSACQRSPREFGASAGRRQPSAGVAAERQGALSRSMLAEWCAAAARRRGGRPMGGRPRSFGYNPAERTVHYACGRSPPQRPKPPVAPLLAVRLLRFAGTAIRACGRRVLRAAARGALRRLPEHRDASRPDRATSSRTSWASRWRSIRSPPAGTAGIPRLSIRGLRSAIAPSPRAAPVLLAAAGRHAWSRGRRCWCSICGCKRAHRSSGPQLAVRRDAAGPSARRRHRDRPGDARRRQPRSPTGCCASARSSCATR